MDRVNDIKAKMFDLQQEADRLKLEYEKSVIPLRDKFQGLNAELNNIMNSCAVEEPKVSSNSKTQEDSKPEVGSK